MHPYGIVIMAAQRPLRDAQRDHRAKENRPVARRRRLFVRLTRRTPLATRPQRRAAAPGVAGCPTTRPGW
jgi:hypothetical protein